MIIESNPFLRNDYYPDQNDIDDLNTRINEVQSDVDLLAISVNEKAEAVNGRLNNLQNDYNESFATESLNANTAGLNVLNVNVQATIKDLNAENTYIENLIVNKPVQDISLRTPHLENTTSLNGNFYAPNILGGVFDSIQIENMQNFKAVNIEAEEVRANTTDFNALNAMNVKADEITANTVNLNAVTANIANLNVLNAVNIEADRIKANSTEFNFLNAVNIEANELRTNFSGVNYLYTTYSEAVNIQADKIIANITNLKDLNATNAKVDKVTANTVDLNALNVMNIQADEVKANKLIGDFLSAEPISSSAVVGYDGNGQLIPIRASYDVSFPEGADYLKTDAQGIARKGTSESEVVQSTNLIQAGAVQNMYDAVNANLNNIESNVKAIDVSILNGIYIPNYGFFDSSSPVNYTNAKTVELYGNAQGGTAIPGGGGMIKFIDSINKVIFGFSGACRYITNTSNMFAYCSNLNQNILIPNTVENASFMFLSCSKLNQNILIPNSVKDTSSMFYGCSNLNQNILIPNTVENASNMFAECSNLDQNILIPNTVVDASSTFSRCFNLNQNILIPNTVENTYFMFAYCSNLNQNILIPNSVKDTSSMFANCSNLNQNILIPNTVVDASFMFANCSNLDQDVYIYSQIINMQGMFRRTKVNLHNVHIPSSVPKSISNIIYNRLVNNATGVTFAPENIINDLPVDPVVWPPIG